MKSENPRPKPGPFRACLRAVGDLMEFIHNDLHVALFGWAGACLGAVLSLGYYRPSSSSWEAIGIGYVAFLALVVVWSVCG